MAFFLVTGGAGFIGSHIVDALVKRGDKVRVLDNLRSGHLDNLKQVSNQIEFIKGDIQDADTVGKCLKGVEGVFHQAALASVPKSVEAPLDSHAACVTGTLNVLDQARRSGTKRVVIASSSSVYGDQPYAAKRESDFPTPLSPYAAAKLSCEFYARSFHATYGLETTCLRYFNVFGPRQDPNSEYSAVIPRFITALLKGQKPIVFGDGQQSRDFIYVENVVKGNLLAYQSAQAAGKVLNLANGRSTTLLELLDGLNKLLGTKVVPEFASARAGDVRDSLADMSHTRSLIGFEPAIEFDEGLDRSIAYYRTICG